jgi:diguanylate cyclase (GGDEF)-like protein/PAS domain S-box-containing protein
MKNDPAREKLLLIDDCSADAKVVRDALAGITGIPFDVECVTQLSAGLERLKKGGISAVLADFFLPDSQGIKTFEALLDAAPQIPILILCALDDEELAMEAVHRGAQDYLLKGHLNSYSLSRALRNMIERTAGAEALFVEKERAQVTLNSIGDAVLSTDIAGKVTYLNLVAEALTGWPREEAAGRPLTDVLKIIDGVTREVARNPMELAVQENRTVGLTPKCILIRRDGLEFAIEDSAAPIHDRSGHVTGAVIVFHDVSAARAMSVRLSHSAQYDFLTDLPNRMLLNDRLTTAISLAHRHSSHLAVLFLDLDGFKHINDSLGHPIGDKLLQSVARRLLALVRGSDTVSRQGGDEFVVLLSELEHPQDAAVSAKKILSTLTAPHSIAGHDLHITGSIGVSIYPADGHDAETLIKNADTAMYYAKENGRNDYQFFEPQMNVRAVERQSLESSLRRALERKEFLLHYQPVVSLKTGRLTGAEALVRWLHPQRGIVAPAQFIPIAEDTGLILPIGQWIMREACMCTREWLDAGLRPPPVAVNISAVEFRSAKFLDCVREILAETRLDPSLLELEVTETVLMQRTESASSLLHALKDMGVHLTVDDFGTGYSSLAYLRRFPINTLKVDKSFVHEISSGPVGPHIVSAVINMGKSLKQRVVAEGVETRAQLAFLQDQHCGEGQGFYFGHPVPANQFAKVLENGISENVAS